MSLKDKVEQLLESALAERLELFLIHCKILGDNTIEVIIDGDRGVTVEDCISISRAIEHNLDRDEEDFSLQVMSSGVSEGLQNIRQYKKNIGRKIKVTKRDQSTAEGELTATTEDDITLVWKAREPKPVGRGKVTVTKEACIPFKEIQDAKVIITF